MLLSEELYHLPHLNTITKLLINKFHTTKSFAIAFTGLLKILYLFQKIYNPTYEEDFINTVSRFGVKFEPQNTSSHPLILNFGDMLYIKNVYNCILSYVGSIVIAIKLETDSEPHTICDTSIPYLSLQDNSYPIQRIPLDVIISAKLALYQACKVILKKKSSQKPSNLQILYDQLATIINLLLEINERFRRQWYIPFDALKLFDLWNKFSCSINIPHGSANITISLSACSLSPDISGYVRTPAPDIKLKDIRTEFDLPYSQVHAILELLKTNTSAQLQVIAELSKIIDQLKDLLRQFYRLYQIEKKEKRKFTPQIYELYNKLGRRYPEFYQSDQNKTDFIFNFRRIMASEFKSFVTSLKMQPYKEASFQFDEFNLRIWTTDYYIIQKGSVPFTLPLVYFSPLLLCRPEHFSTLMLDMILSSAMI